MSEKTILAVDDEAENLTMLGGLLRDRYKVKVAKNGEGALKLCEGSPAPDLVLLDVMMPGMDGHAVLSALKANAATAKIPVIFLSAHTDPAEIRKGLDAGAVAFLSKPVDGTLLFQKLSEILG